MAKDPHCNWCGVEVVFDLFQEQPLPDNFGTVDHLYSRKHKKERQEAMHKGIKAGSGFGVYYVLACNKCNSERSKLGL